jgi:hypothetical protein
MDRAMARNNRDPADAVVDRGQAANATFLKDRAFYGVDAKSTLP